MRWRRCDPVQDVGALLVCGADAASRLSIALSQRIAVLSELAVEHGDGWAAVVSDRTAMLPRIDGAIALYEAAPGWWFPVGVELDVPGRAHAALLTALAAHNGIWTAGIVVPRFDTDGASATADFYPVGNAVPFRISELAEQAA